MSGIVALVAPSGETISRLLVERMLEAQRHRGPQGFAVWTEGPVALGYARLAVTPEAVGEQQPRSSRSGAAHAVLDGRLDNRQELTEAVLTAGHAPASDADVDLLLAAYEVWGEECAERLLGDFAFALWDVRRRALVCARDLLGGRPLYVHAREGLTAVASEVAPLVLLPGVRREPNEGFIAECLSGQIVSRTDTPWRDVVRLEPAHLLTLESGTIRRRRYWQPDPGFEIRHQRDDEYGDHLADLVRSAIAPRLRAAGRIGIMLSGGIDSSSIVGAMHQMQAVTGCAPLPAYSIVGPGEPWDETPYINAVAAKWPIRSQLCPAFHSTPAHLAAAAVRVQDLPPYPNGEMANTLFTAACADQVQVLLTGSWSDSWLAGSFHGYADLAASLRLAALWKHFHAQPGGVHTFRPRSMFRSLLWPLVPAPVRRAVKTALGRDGISPWVMPRLAASTGLRDRLMEPPHHLAFPTRAQGDLYRMAFSGDVLHGTEAHERAASLFGLDTRHPFGDRRIVEFGLALPEDQRWHGPLTKFALRNAARDWLPAMILRRTSDEGSSAVVYAAVRDLVAAGLWQNPVMARRGWVALDALSRAFNDMTARYHAGDERYDELANRLWLVCAVELWARHVLEEEPHA